MEAGAGAEAGARAGAGAAAGAASCVVLLVVVLSVHGHVDLATCIVLEEQGGYVGKGCCRVGRDRGQGGGGAEKPRASCHPDAE